jgi:hypothetical protein
LLLYRREDLTARWPAELSSDLERLNARVSAALTAFVERHPGIDHEHLVFAVIDVPYGGVRRYLALQQPPPALADQMIVTACRAVLGSSPARSA